MVGYAQKQTVTGTVVSSIDGMGIPGVNVLIKGTSSGTSTDFDGNFSIEVSNGEAVLVFSYVGFTEQEITVGSKRKINVSLKEDANAFEYKRWYDIARRRMGPEVFGASGLEGAKPGFDENQDYLYLLPADELARNPNLMPNNPGY